jgi:hypothetical protein
MREYHKAPTGKLAPILSVINTIDRTFSFVVLALDSVVRGAVDVDRNEERLRIGPISLAACPKISRISATKLRKQARKRTSNRSVVPPIPSVA